MTATGRPTTEARLRELCEHALKYHRGDTAKAYEHLNAALLSANDASLERELCSAYRSAAIRAWLAETYHAMRSKGLVPRSIPEHKIPTTQYDVPRGPRTGDLLHVQMQPSAVIRRYLDSFLVNGEPIGDCTAETVMLAADKRDMDTSFMRYMANGVPPNGRIRDYRTEEEAATFWTKGTP
jgi:hypothetical protein